MATMYDCLQSAYEQGAISKELKDDYQREFNELFENYRRGLPEDAAAVAAAQDLKEAARRSNTARRHAVLNQLTTMRANVARINATDRPDKSIIHALNAYEGFSDGGESVVQLRQSLERDFNGMIGRFLSQTRENFIGRSSNPALVKDVIRELHGQGSGNANARQLAEAIDKAREHARQMFNAHGGDIGKLDNYGVVHTHDRIAIERGGFNAWRDKITPLLDWDRITNRKTGKPYRPDTSEADAFLKEVFDGITSADWDTRAASWGGQKGKALYNQRAAPRSLHFRDGDAWMEYNDAFGSQNPFDAIISTFSGYARDIALLRVLGPNPEMGLKHMIQLARKRVMTDPRLTPEQRAAQKKNVDIAEERGLAMLSHITGAATRPVDDGVAVFLAGTRQVLVSSQLGSAILSSLTDLYSMGLAAASVGMNPLSPIKRHIDLIFNSSTRELAGDLGYIADSAAQAGSAVARFQGEMWSPDVTRRLSNFVMRAQGLTFWTDMGRMSWRLENSRHLAELAQFNWGDLDPNIRSIFDRRGITAEDWDQLRNPDLAFTAANGSRFISPNTWREAALARGIDRSAVESLALRIGAIIEEQLEFAIPTTNLEMRVRFGGAQRPGTFAGELSNSFLMYKNYPLSLTLNQFRRILARPTSMSRAQYAASMIAGFTLMGAVGVQLKELAKGRDPRPMDDPAFWGAAMLQGGGAGIFGDFFSSETSRAGGGLQETLTGPMVGLGADLTRAVASNAQRVAEGKDMLIGRDVANLARRYTPGTSLWYARAALDRMVWDQLQQVLDPEADAGFRRAVSRARRETGNDYWWTPGEATPDRAPDLSNVVSQ